LLLWGLAIGNLLLGWQFSSATRLRRVVVDGALPAEQSTLREILQSVSGKPWSRINSANIESLAQFLPGVDSARFEGNALGRARLTLRRRLPQAIAEVPGGVLSDLGRVDAGSTVGAGLRVYHEPLPSLGLAGGVPYRALTEIFRRAAQEGWPLRSVEFEPSGSLCLNMKDGRIVLGTLRDLDRKLDTIQRRREAFPNELRGFAELNVMAPEDPTLRPKIGTAR
jgi:hypothetical protein